MTETAIKELEQQLIQILAQDATQSSEAIAKKLYVSARTVRRLTNKLCREEIIRIAAVQNAHKVGLPVTCMVSLHLAQSSLEAAMELFSNLPEISWVATTTGRYNLVAVAHFASTQKLAEFTERQSPKIKGLKDSEILICLKVKKCGARYE